MRIITCAVIIILLAGISYATELTIGLIPEQNVFKQFKRYKPLGEYIEKKTGIKVNFTVLPRYGNIINSFSSKKIDGAFWGSFTGALAIEQLGVEPLARPVNIDGTSTYHGYIFVRKDSGIGNTDEMKGKVIAFVEKATTAGYVFPMAFFRMRNINIDAHFKKYLFTGSHDAAIHAVINKEADIGCAKNTIFDMLSHKDPRIKEDLHILSRSPNVPSNAFAIRKDIEVEIKDKLTAVFLGMHDDTQGRDILREFGALRFIKTQKKDYSHVFDLAQKAGIDIKHYKYHNK